MYDLEERVKLLERHIFETSEALSSNFIGVNPNGTVAVVQDLINVKDPPFSATGNGVTDDTAAINAALLSSDVIYFPAGDYLGEDFKVPSNTRVFASKNARLLHKPNSVFPLLEFTGDNSTVEGLELDGNRASQVNLVKGVEINGSQNRLTDCYIHAVKHDGVYVRNDAVGIEIDHNWVNDTGRYGITVGGDTPAQAPQFVNVHDNVVHDSNDGAYGIVGIGQHILFANNLGYDTVVGDGIAAYNADNYDVRAIGNIFSNCGNHGIHLGGNKLTISDNNIDSVQFNGILLQNPDALPAQGFEFVIDGNRVNNAGLGGNLANGFGIYTNRYSQGTICGNQIIGSFSRNINLEDSHSVNLSGNNVEESASDGMRIDSLCTEVTIGACNFRNNAGNGINTAGLDTVISDCNCTGNGGNGINVGGDFTSVVGGISRGNGLSGIAWGTFTNNWASGVITDDTNQFAAGTAVILPLQIDVFHCSSAPANLDSINSNSSVANRRITIVFNQATTVKDGTGNLILNGDFNALADDSLSLACDGSDWYETSRVP